MIEFKYETVRALLAMTGRRRPGQTFSPGVVGSNPTGPSTGFRYDFRPRLIGWIREARETFEPVKRSVVDVAETISDENIACNPVNVPCVPRSVTSQRPDSTRFGGAEPPGLASRAR